MTNRAWAALGAACVLVTAAGGCDRGPNGRARGEALAAGDDSGAGDDESGVDSAEELALTPDVEAPDIESPPDAAGDDAAGSGEDASQSGEDDSGSSDDSTTGPVVVVDSGSGATPGGTVDASAESGGAADAGMEAAGPIESGSVAESGAPPPPPRAGLHPLATRGATAPANPVGAAVGGAPSTGDDTSSFEDAGLMFDASWTDDDGSAPPALEMQPGRAVLGCAGCSVPDAGTPGAAAWLVVVLTVAARARRRRRTR